MAIEIRELIIRTEIIAEVRPGNHKEKERQLEKLKKQVLQEVKIMIATAGNRKIKR